MKIATYAIALLLGSATLPAGSADPLERLDRERATFLCEWSRAHALTGNPEPLAFCEVPNGAEIEVDTIRDQIKRWWKFWEEKKDGVALKNAFENDWRAHRQQLQADAQAKEEEELSRNVHTMKSLELCETYYNIDSKAAYTELQKRKALTAAEWDLIRNHRIRVGMSELATFRRKNDIPRETPSGSVFCKVVPDTASRRSCVA